jgi:hypothetical protein
VGKKRSWFGVQGARGVVEFPISNKEYPMMKESIVDLQDRRGEFVEMARKNNERR